MGRYLKKNKKTKKKIANELSQLNMTYRTTNGSAHENNYSTPVHRAREADVRTLYVRLSTYREKDT